jgi:hypothetical protein
VSDPAVPPLTPSAWPPGSVPGRNRVPRWLRRLPPVVKIALLVTILVALGVVIKDAVTPGPTPRCVFACEEVLSAIPADHSTFTSTTYGFSFDYLSGASMGTVSSPAVADLVYTDNDNSFAGELLVDAGTGTPRLSSLISQAASELGNVIGNLKDTGPMLGAEIGLQPGEGEFYSGTYPQPSGSAVPAVIGTVAAQHGDLWVCLIGISATDPSSSAPPAFQIFDDIIDRWRWGS